MDILQTKSKFEKERNCFYKKYSVSDAMETVENWETLFSS